MDGEKLYPEISSFSRLLLTALTSMPVFPGTVIPVIPVFDWIHPSFSYSNRAKIFIENSPACRPGLPCEIPHGFPSALIMHKAQCVGLVAKNVPMPVNAALQQRNESALSGLPILF